ncbi:MAG: Rab family GTPase [Thermoplasmata archaeon]
MTKEKDALWLEMTFEEGASHLKDIVGKIEGTDWILLEGRLLHPLSYDIQAEERSRLSSEVSGRLCRMKELLEGLGIIPTARLIISNKKDGNAIPLRHERMKMKICLLGDRGVGKTSLVRKHVLGQFDDRYLPTIGAKVMKKRIEVPMEGINTPTQIDMTIWDIAGERRFDRRLLESYLEGAQGLLAVCDVTEKKTLAHIDDWVDGAFKITGSIPTHIIANKCDLHDSFRIGASEVALSSEAYDSYRLFTSAKRGDNVNTVFYDLARRVLESQLKSRVPSLRGRS